MSTVGLWLVVGGAALATLCIVVAATLLVRVFRTAARRAAAPKPANTLVATATRWRGVLERAAAGAGADAAALRLQNDGDSLGLSAGEAAALVAELAATTGRPRYLRYRAAAGNGAGGLRNGLVVPVPGGGALGVYWRRELVAPPEQALPPLAALARVVGGTTPRPPAAAPPDVRRLRTVASLAATIDLADLARRMLEAVVAEPGADAAAIGVRSSPAEPLLVDTLNLSQAESEWLTTSLAAEGQVASITRYLEGGAAPETDDERPIATMIVVPLGDRDGDRVGNLAALWRHDVAGRADARLAELERFAGDVRDVLDNALRFRRLQAPRPREP